MNKKTNAEVLGEALMAFESLDEEDQDFIAEYIECCNGPVCYFDGKDTSLCIPCKVNWLKQEWEGNK